MGGRRLFGTDGIRGLANQHPMTAEVAMRLGRVIGYRLRAEGHRARVIVGKDTRRSCYMIENALIGGLCSAGADVWAVGPLPTPGVAFLTATMRADAGLMISASHNPFQDNGIKIFGRDGFKLPDAVEAELEQLMGHDRVEAFRPTGAAIGRVYRMMDAGGRYEVFAKAAFPRSLTLEGLKIVVDCAHGATYKVAPEALHQLGAQVVRLGVEPNGLNINERSGALHPQVLADVVRESGADVGLALDGDGDRCIMADERGQVIDGDVVMAILADRLLRDGALARRTVVATVMSNLGLERALERMGAALVRTPVGDRYVVECMRREGYNFGGEQSGHMIALDHTTTGDGLITGLLVLSVLVREQRPLSELAGCMTRYPQVLQNLRVREKPPLGSIPSVAAAIEAVEAELGDEGRVLVRYSGTELKARVMVEGPDDRTCQRAASHISEAIVAAIGAESGP